jgi:hypothetical protein
LEDFHNNLVGEVVAIIPNAAPVPFTLHAKVNFVLIVEQLPRKSTAVRTISATALQNRLIALSGDFFVRDIPPCSQTQTEPRRDPQKLRL